MELGGGESAAESLIKIGKLAVMRSDLAMAEKMFLSALKVEPRNAEALSALGLVWQHIGDVQDAWKCYYEALKIDPNNVSAINNCGWLQDASGYREAARRAYERCLELKPGWATATGNLAANLLRAGEYARGFDLLDARFHTQPRITYQRHYLNPPIPFWTGGDLPTKLGIWTEQGLGDEILYYTLLPQLLSLGVKVIAEADARLLPALRRSFPEQQFETRLREQDFELASVKNKLGMSPFVLGGCSHHIAAGSLPAILRRTAESFRGQPKQLLYADPERADRYLSLLSVQSNKKNVAIAWRSFQPNINKFTGDTKSASLAAFEPLGRREDIQLITVQYGDVRDEINAFQFPLGIMDDLDLREDVDGILALIDACDAVVTTSQVAAHFGGALGKSTYVLQIQPSSNHYYWESRDGKCDWYPSVRIVTAPTWAKAIDLVNDML